MLENYFTFGLCGWIYEKVELVWVFKFDNFRFSRAILPLEIQIWIPIQICTNTPSHTRTHTNNHSHSQHLHNTQHTSCNHSTACSVSQLLLDGCCGTLPRWGETVAAVVSKKPRRNIHNLKTDNHLWRGIRLQNKLSTAQIPPFPHPLTMNS